MFNPLCQPKLECLGSVQKTPARIPGVLSACHSTSTPRNANHWSRNAGPRGQGQAPQAAGPLGSAATWRPAVLGSPTPPPWGFFSVPGPDLARIQPTVAKGRGGTHHLQLSPPGKDTASDLQWQFYPAPLSRLSQDTMLPLFHSGSWKGSPPCAPSSRLTEEGPIWIFGKGWAGLGCQRVSSLQRGSFGVSHHICMIQCPHRHCGGHAHPWPER